MEHRGCLNLIKTMKTPSSLAVWFIINVNQTTKQIKNKNTPPPPSKKKTTTQNKTKNQNLNQNINQIK